MSLFEVEAPVKNRMEDGKIAGTFFFLCVKIHSPFTCSLRRLKDPLCVEQIAHCHHWHHQELSAALSGQQLSCPVSVIRGSILLGLF